MKLATKTIKYHCEGAKSTTVIAVAGGFNNWVPQNMERDAKDTELFTVNVQVLVGYRFRFCFFNQPHDTPFIDKSKNNLWSARQCPFGLKESNYLEGKKGLKESAEDPDIEKEEDMPAIALQKFQSFLPKEAANDHKQDSLDKLGV
jgi:hypothetical protein